MTSTALTIEQRNLEAQREQERLGVFVRAFLRSGRDAVAAAREAGYEAPETTGPILATRPDVAGLLRAAEGARLEAADLTPARLHQRLAAFALARPVDAFDANGHPLPLGMLPDQLKDAIVDIEMTRYGPKFKFGDPLKAANLAADVLGMRKMSVAMHHSGGIETKINLDSLSDADIDRLLESRREPPRRVEAVTVDFEEFVPPDETEESE